MFMRSSIVAPMSKSTHSLADLYDLSITRLFLTGPQAILRMVLMQSERDRQAGLDTAGYISGYRGSPVGTVDNQFQSARKVLEPRNIRFQAGLNEDLAATAIWGTQQAEMRGEGKHDGVFGVWYGKGPGVDRTGDVFRHANMAGTSPHGGVLAIAGDDHSGESSTVVHASDIALTDAMIPVLAPAGVQEIIDFGLLGLALSRYASVWVGLKCVHDTVESSAVVEAGLDRVTPVIPKDLVLPPDGLSIRPSDDRIVQEERLHMQKIPAVKAFTRVNGINRIVHAGRRGAKDRHRRCGQGLSRRAPGARRSRHRRGAGRETRHPGSEDRHGVAARALDHPGLCQGALAPSWWSRRSAR